MTSAALLRGVFSSMRLVYAAFLPLVNPACRLNVNLHTDALLGLGRVYDSFSMENETLGDRLQKARHKAGLTLQQVADALGLTRGAVGAWEQGRNVPDAIRIGRLANLYKTTTDSLISGENVHSPDLIRALEAVLKAHSVDGSSEAERGRNLSAGHRHTAEQKRLRRPGSKRSKAA